MSSETYIGGFHAVTAALDDAEKKPREVLITGNRGDARMTALLKTAEMRGVTVRVVSKDQLDMYAPGLRHQGVIAAVSAADFVGEEALEVPATPDRLVLVLDGVQDPHNLGACLRTAEAVGVTAIIIPKDRAVGLTPVARKAAAGAAERIPVVAVTNLARTLEKLKSLGYWVTGLAGESTETIYDVDLTGPTVLVMGSEGEGMRRLTREGCDRLVKIPMVGKMESLNVSVAAAVCLYESFRQRQPPRPVKGGKKK